MRVRRNPYAFTELGVAMLSSVLNSKTAIQINMGIMRAFVAVRQMIALPKTDQLTELQNEMKELKDYIEEVFADYNDINDDTRMQLELIIRHWLNYKPRRNWKKSHAEESDLYSMTNNLILSNARFYKNCNTST